MVVCKFFLAGNCRFGSSCRYEHTYSSKYSYHAPPPQNNPPPQQQQAGGATDEQLLNQVRADVQAALSGGQWMLSSYSPFKEKPVLPGIPDLSPEEVRLFIYEGKARNNVEQAVAYINNLTQETKQKYEALLQPSPGIINTLRNLYKGEHVTSPFTSGQTTGFANSNSGASIFRTAVQNSSSFGQSSNNVFGQTSPNTAASVFAQANQNTNTAASIFGQANSVFSGSTDAKSVFAQASTDAKSVFAQASQNVFAPPTSPFAQSPDPAKSIFAQANQSPQLNQNVFQSPPQQPTNPASIFANANASPPASFFNAPPAQHNPFLQQCLPPPTANIYQGGNQFTESDIYSELKNLSNSELEVFKSPSFKLGFIPELPPPLELVLF